MLFVHLACLCFADGANYGIRCYRIDVRFSRYFDTSTGAIHRREPIYIPVDQDEYRQPEREIAGRSI